MLRRKFISVNAYIKKVERSPVNNLTVQFMTVEREEQIKRKQAEEGNNKDCRKLMK